VESDFRTPQLLVVLRASIVIAIAQARIARNAGRSETATETRRWYANNLRQRSTGTHQPSDEPQATVNPATVNQMSVDPATVGLAPICRNRFGVLSTHTGKPPLSMPLLLSHASGLFRRSMVRNRRNKLGGIQNVANRVSTPNLLRRLGTRPSFALVISLVCGTKSRPEWLDAPPSRSSSQDPPLATALQAALRSRLRLNPASLQVDCRKLGMRYTEPLLTYAKGCGELRYSTRSTWRVRRGEFESVLAQT
jgi:hypothetical protein